MSSQIAESERKRRRVTSQPIIVRNQLTQLPTPNLESFPDRPSPPHSPSNSPDIVTQLPMPNHETIPDTPSPPRSPPRTPPRTPPRIPRVPFVLETPQQQRDDALDLAMSDDEVDETIRELFPRGFFHGFSVDLIEDRYEWLQWRMFFKQIHKNKRSDSQNIMNHIMGFLYEKVEDVDEYFSEEEIREYQATEMKQIYNDKVDWMNLCHGRFDDDEYERHYFKYVLTNQTHRCIDNG